MASCPVAATAVPASTTPGCCAATPPTRLPQPRLADLPTLISQVRQAGLPVELHIGGQPRDLPAGIELSAFRIVQEALTNALKHADPARAQVSVRYRTDTLELEITDGGHGLAGMRERVVLLPVR